MDYLKNLFDNPTTLRDPAHFVGRRSQLERIFSLIKDKQNISLVGSRRIGKTSLLTCLKSELIQQQFHFDGSGFRFFYLDLQKRSMRAEVDFFDETYRIIREHAQSEGYRINEEGNRDDRFIALLDEFEQRGLYPVLMMDTFDEIIQYQPIPENVFSFLRSQGTGGRLSYIIASVETLGDIFRKLLLGDNQLSPFINIFGTISLTSFTLQEAQQMLVTTSVKSGLPFNQEEVDWVVQMAGTHPFLLQQVATLLFEEKRVHGGGDADFAYIYKEAQRNVFDHFEDWWTMFSQKERQAIIQGITLFEENGQKSRSYPDLCYSQLFRDYMRETGKLVVAPSFPPLPKVDASSIKITTYKTILKSLHDPARLGECVLIGIPLIRARIEQRQAILPNVRGKIVEEVLREALKGMEGQEPRSDSSPAWTYYNILYYCYFMRNHKMTQAQIAGRLLLSERQYYRLIPDALERLRNELLALDAKAVMSSEM